MATSRIKTSSILQGFPKSRSLLAGNTAYSPTAYESIATATVGSGGSSAITFSSIPSTYSHLQLRMIARDNRSGNVVSNINMYFNNDTGANYAQHFILADNLTLSTGLYGSQTEMFASRIPGALGGANMFGAAIVDIFDYSSPDKNTTTKAINGLDNNGSNWEQLYFASNLWVNTAVVNRIDLTPVGTAISQYSHFALYGIKGV